MNKLLILSGGMDSVTALHQFKDEIGLAVSFKYPSKHNSKEIACAVDHAKQSGVKHIIVDLTEVFKHFKSNLLEGQGDIPEGHYEAESMKDTVVPFRNGIFISVATGLAESNNLNAVILGSHAGDHAIYPDCRVSFNKSMVMAMMEGTDNKVTLMTPYAEISKRVVAKIGWSLGLDYSDTWSCYNGREKHCGKCGTCIERKEALEGNDYTEYEE